MHHNSLSGHNYGFSPWGETEGVEVPVTIHHALYPTSSQAARTAIHGYAELDMNDDHEPMTPFERTWAEYAGLDTRGTPTIGYEDDISEIIA